MGVLLASPCSNEVVQDLKRLTAHLDSLLAKDQLFWCQRSKAIWLKVWDRNSKFFHKKATSRLKRNALTLLFDREGRWQDSHQGFKTTVVLYFQHLFQSNGNNDFEELGTLVENRATP